MQPTTSQRESNPMNLLKTSMKKAVLLFALLLATGINSFAQERWNELTFPEIKSFTKPNVTTFTLKNGIKVYLVEDNELPVINMSVLVRTGSILEPADKIGLASMTGMVIRSGGSAKHPADQLNTLLENKAASIGTSISFSAGNASLFTLKEDFNTLVPVFVDVITNPSFPDDKIELARRQTKSGISRRNDDAQGVAGREFDRLIYGDNSVYSRQVEYSTVDNITRDDMVAFHRNAFVGSNMFLQVVGDFKTADMRKTIERHFNTLPKGKASELSFPEVDYQMNAKINLVDKKDAQQSVVYLGHEGGLRTDPDYAALRLMNQLLGGGFSGRLFKKVRTDMGLAYAVFANYESNINYKGSFYAGVMTKPETTAEAIDAIKGEIIRLQEEPVSEAELNKIKDQLFNSLVFRYTSRAAVLNERISNEYNGVPADLFDRFMDEVKQVTPADIQRVAKTKLRPDDMQILVVSNKAAVESQLSKYGAIREIDITIPTPQAAAKAPVTGDTKGKEWLNKMADAVVAQGTNFRGIQATGKVSQGPMSMDAVSTMIFPSEMLVDINSPMGSIRQNYKDGVAVMRVGEQEQNMGADGAAEIQMGLDTHYLSIALRKNQLDASFAGMETVDGAEYGIIEVNMGRSVKYWVSTETGLPLKMETRRFLPQTGSEATVRTSYKNWKEVDGVKVAFGSDQFIDGNPAGGTTYTTVVLVR
jgi:predicted Zn-dependent peptidase